jgi:hypothetical protein
MSKKNVISFVSILLVLSLLAILPMVFAVEPFGASVTPTSNTRAAPDEAGNHSAYAGNVSELVMSGFSNTQTWQGYYGNVTGTVQLADSNDFVMYNWTLTTPSGEVYASTNGTVSWTNIQCFNFTADGDFTSESGNGGTTSLYGTNLSQLELAYNINLTAVDGVDETFTLSGAGTHDLFYTANQQFSEGECRNTRVFDDTGAGVTNKYEEVLLYEPVTTSVVFAAILEDDAAGFNSKTSDFEMLVLEDGHGTDVAATVYYFFVELE